MNPEIKTKWVAKLRDPDTKQGYNALAYPNGARCCLGVLCDIAVQDHLIRPPVSNFDDDSEGGLYYEDRDKVLPSRVGEWADVSSPNGTFALPHGPDIALSELNDSLFTFSQIADVIEYFF